MIFRASTLFALLLTQTSTSAAEPLYKIETLAGTGWTGDGRSASTAILVQPQCVAVDRVGNIYVSDSSDHRVRRIGMDGIIRTIAGTGAPGIRGDGGPALQAQLNSPYGLAVDTAGNVFIADLGNGAVRRVGLDGTLQTVAGGGRDTITANTALPARNVKLSQPRDVAIDRGGNLLIADFGAHRVYSVTPGGMLSVVAGTGEPGSILAQTPALAAPLVSPAGLAIDATGVVLIADSGNRRVRRLGFGNLWTLTDKLNRVIEFGTPTGIATDATGRIYVADGGTTEVTVVTASGDLTTVPVGGTSVAVTPSFDVITTSERRVRRLTGTRVEIVAGQGTSDGRVPSEWRFSSPSAAVRDSSGSLWIADTALGRIRKLSPAGELTTVTSLLQNPVSLAIDSFGHIWAGDRTGNGGVYQVDSAGGPKPLVQGENRFIVPAAMAFDRADNLYIADSANGLIRRVAPDGSMIVIAGGGRDQGDGPVLQLKLSDPAGIAVDSTGTVWFSEAGTARIRKIVAGRVTTLAGTELLEPRGIRFDRDGNLWVADTGAHRIVVFDASGNWTPIAGWGDRGFAGDGEMALAAMLNGPIDVVPEPDGSVLVVDTGNDRIRRITKLPNEPGNPATPGVPPDPGQPPGGVTESPITVLHAATLLASDVAPGQLVYITGQNLTSSEVSIGGQSLPLLESTATRLTVRIPPTIQLGFVEASVRSNGALYGRAAVKIVASSAGILTVAGGKGQALVINADGTLNGIDHPAARGAVISLFITGEGSATPGAVADIGGYAADVVWSGPAPGYPGVLQVNVQTPGGFSPSGVLWVTLAFDGLRTQPGATIVSR